MQLAASYKTHNQIDPQPAHAAPVFQGSIFVTKDKLVALFGEPLFGPSWRVEFADGRQATIIASDSQRSDKLLWSVVGIERIVLERLRHLLKE